MNLFGSEGRATASTAATEVVLVDGAPTQRVMLMPMGTIPGRDGGAVARGGKMPWCVVDIAHARSIVEATQRDLGQIDLVIDYDHQTEFGAKPGVGGRAIAAGWAAPAEIEATEEGIFANVRWTPAAASHLGDREYRYISPTFGFNKTSGRVTRIHSAALVNIPAIEMRAAASHSTGEDDDMDLKAIAAALGLGEDADAAAIIAAIDAKKAEATAAASAIAGNTASIGAIATALALKPGASVDEIVSAATEVKATAAAGFDPTKFVPIEQVNLLHEQLQGVDESRATAAVDAAIVAGKLAPAVRQWGLDLFKKDETAFAGFLDKSPAILKPGQEDLGNKGKSAILSDDEKAMATRLGVSEESFLAARAEEEGA